MATREQIYSALFAKVSAATGFTTTTRRLRHIDEVDGPAMPALFQLEKREHILPSVGKATKRTLKVDLYIYVYTPDPNEVPSTKINNILDAIDAALLPDNPILDTCTLSGLVHHVWVNGEIEIYEGIDGSKTAAIMPLEILTNA